MNRSYRWVVLIAVGMMLGYFVHSLDRSAETFFAPQNVHAQEEGDDLAEQIKEINNQVKEINAMLQSGKLRVVVEIYPENT
jgi:hypothetical protein